MEIVIYKGRCYNVSRFIDKEDEKLLTPQKQFFAKLYFYKGLNSKDIARILNVDETLLQVWYENEMKRTNISKSVTSFNEGRSRKVICTNTETGKEIEYISLSACAKACGCVASTILYKIKHNKTYKNYVFRYADED